MSYCITNRQCRLLIDEIFETESEAIEYAQETLGLPAGGDWTVTNYDAIAKQMEVPEQDYSTPTKFYCNRCKAWSPVKKVNKANKRHADPTNSYTLECGHTVI